MLDSIRNKGMYNMKTNITALFLVAAPLLLAGCGREMPHEWRPHDPGIQSQTVQENIVFAGKETKLTDAQQMQLKGVLQSAVGAKSSSVKIYTHDTSDNLKKSPLKERVHNIINAFIKMGVSRNGIEVVSDAVSGEDAGTIITVETMSYVAKAPKCHGWNYSMDRFLPPEGEVDFGCASASNLAAMVANPQDLVNGQPLGKGDAQRNDLAVQNYRTDKTTKLLTAAGIVSKGTKK